MEEKIINIINNAKNDDDILELFRLNKLYSLNDIENIIENIINNSTHVNKNAKYYNYLKCLIPNKNTLDKNIFFMKKYISLNKKLVYISDKYKYKKYLYKRKYYYKQSLNYSTKNKLICELYCKYNNNYDILYDILFRKKFNVINGFYNILEGKLYNVAYFPKYCYLLIILKNLFFIH